MPEASRLQSWKEIAVFLRRSVATVQRWEREEGLPVHRHFHHKLGSVYAYPAELDAWRDGLRAHQPRHSHSPAAENSRPSFAQHLTQVVTQRGTGAREQLRHFQQLTGMRVRAFLSQDHKMASELASAQLEIAQALGDEVLLAEVHTELGFLQLDDFAKAAEHARLAMDALRTVRDSRRPANRTLLLEIRLLAALTKAFVRPDDQKKGMRR